MNYNKFEFSSKRYLILATEARYTRTTGGRWIPEAGPEAVKRYTMTPEQYTNFVKAAPWFNSFFKYDFDGKPTAARCTISRGYTCTGYLPTGSRNTSPDGRQQVRHKIEFLPLEAMTAAAGYRENYVLQTADSWSYDYSNGYELFTFYSSDGERAATWSQTRRAWVN